MCFIVPPISIPLDFCLTDLNLLARFFPFHLDVELSRLSLKNIEIADCRKIRLSASERARNTLSHLAGICLPLRGTKMQLEPLRSGSYEEHGFPTNRL